MLEKYVDQLLENIEKELEDPKEPKFIRIKAQLDRLNNNSPAYYYVLTSSLLITAGMYLMRDIDEEAVDSTFYDVIHEHIEDMLTLKQRYIFKVELIGFEDKIRRIISVPIGYSVSDLGIGIVLAFHGDFSHLMCFEIGKKCYSIFFDDFNLGDRDARDYILKDLSLRKNTKIRMMYDFGENYEFRIQLIDRVVEEELNPLIHVLEGKGYGILEDDICLLHAYYDNPNATMPNQNRENISIKECIGFDLKEFDLEEVNNYIETHFIQCQENINKDMVNE